MKHNTITVALAAILAVTSMAIVTPSFAASKKATTTATQPAAAVTGPVDLNTATQVQLVALSGVGPAKAAAIISGRPYKSLADFSSKNILSASVVSKLGTGITVATVAPARAAKSAATGATGGQAGEQDRIKQCGSMWKAAKAANQVSAGQTWPQYWSACDAQLKAKS